MRALNSLMGAKLHFISGYPGMAEVLLAIERGELDGVAGTTWDALKATRARWFSSGDAQVLLQYGDARHPDLPDVPATGELMYEYACHEGNYALGNILRGARLKETNDAKKTIQR